jgi:hypothetical protein
MTIEIDLDGGCMPLYSSKGLKKITLKPRRNNTNVEIPYLVQEIACKTLTYQEYSTTFPIK